MKQTLVLLTLCLVAAPPPQVSSQSAERVVARAGKLFISEDEFLRRFELTPAFGRHRKSKLEEAKLELVYSMIAEKLLAQEASDRGMDQDTLVRRAVTEITKLLVRDELYRKEISGKVTLSPGEISEGVRRARTEILLAFLFFESESEGRFIRSQIKKPADFDRLQIDTTIRALRDTATVIWGDADPVIEDAAYRLKADQVSPVVRAGEGFYILKVSRMRLNPLTASMQPAVLRERAESTLRLRKERARLDPFVADLLKGKPGYAHPRTFKIVASELSQVLAGSPGDSARSLTPEMYSRLRRQCASVLNDTFAVAGSEVWSVGEIIDRLSVKSMNLHGTDSVRVAAWLNGTVRVWVQQELIAQEALRRGLDRVPVVAGKVEMWRQYTLAEQAKQLVRRSVKISESEVWAYLRSLDTAAAVPRVRIRELHTNSLDDMQSALEEIQRGSTFDAAVRKWSTDSTSRKSGGMTQPFRIFERPPLGEIAWQLNPGERAGPLPEGKGSVTIELVEKDPSPAPEDTAFVTRWRRASGELRAMKERRTISTFLAQSGQERGFSIYQDRLLQIPVSPVPMLTFRILGFGGRMFEVPFIDKQLDWLNIEPPPTRIVP